MSDLNCLPYYYKNHLFTDETLHNYTAVHTFICSLNIDQYFSNPLKDKNEKQIYLDLKEDYGLEYTLAIPAHGMDYYAVYFFAAQKDKPHIIDTFTTKLDLFQNFILHFEGVAKNTIIRAEKNRIITNYPTQNISFTQKIKHGQHITARERECIRFIMLGLSAKEIGNLHRLRDC